MNYLGVNEPMRSNECCHFDFFDFDSWFGFGILSMDIWYMLHVCEMDPVVYPGGEEAVTAERDWAALAIFPGSSWWHPWGIHCENQWTAGDCGKGSEVLAQFQGVVQVCSWVFWRRFEGWGDWERVFQFFVGRWSLLALPTVDGRSQDFEWRSAMHVPQTSRCVLAALFLIPTHTHSFFFAMYLKLTTYWQLIT